MQRKIIFALLGILVLAIGVWVGAYYWQSLQQAGIDRGTVIGPSASVTSGEGHAGGGGQAGSAAVLPEERVEPGELLVADPPKGFADVAEGMGFSVIGVTTLGQLDMQVYRMAIPRGSSVAEARRTLSARFPGIAIDAHQIYEAQSVDEYRQETARPSAGWPLSSVGCGAGIRLGQIDSSVDLTHPALQDRRIEYHSFNRPDRRPGPADHGTAVAAMLVGLPEWGGLLPGAELIAANMFEYNEQGSVVGSGLGLLEAVDWMIEKQVQVVNLSVAGGDNKVVRKAFSKADAKGLILVAAAGNWGSATRPAYPAAYTDVIAVTAMDRHREPYKKANQGSYIDFVAPGVRIYTAVPQGGRIMSGTSFATPYLTVLIAMYLEAGAPRSPTTLRELLSKQTEDLGTPGKDDVYGWGFVKLRPKCQ